jgi:molybdenum cofactor cytidylyltransferase
MNPAVAAIVVAAGRSRRMGCCKQLLDLGGKPVIVRCLEALLAGGVADIVVVVGLQGGEVAVAVAPYPVRVAVTANPDGDMASSILTGRADLAADTDGVIVALGDCPLVRPATIARLGAEHRLSPESILLPCHEGRKGHPVLLPLACLDELSAGGTLRDVVRCRPQRVKYCPVDDPGILEDMDTPEDYQRIRASYSQV